MQNKIKTVKHYINGLKTVENRIKFAKELYEANNPEYAGITIYYDFDKPGIYCDAVSQSTIIPNTIYLAEIPKFIDFDVMTKGEYMEFVNNLIDDLEDMFVWVYYDEKGEKEIL